MTGRPVPQAQLPEGVTCATTASGRISDADLAVLDQFRQFLADDKAATTPGEKQRVLREYLKDSGIADDEGAEK